MQEDNSVKTFSKEKKVHGLTLTTSAVLQIQLLLEKNPGMLGLRVGVKQSGCAGFSYVMEKVMCAEDEDRVYEHNGVRLYVSPKTVPFIDGTELDYVQEGLNHLFKFNNPKVQFACGCGESFGF